MFEVVEIRNVAHLEPLRLSWNVLLSKTRDASFFQSLDWLSSYWEHFADCRQPRVLVVMHRGTPLGIVPLTLATERTCVGSVRTLTYPLDDWGSFFGPIGPDPAATLTVAMQYLRRARRDWDLLDLRWVDKQLRDRRRTLWAMMHAGLQAKESVWSRISLVDLNGSWNRFLESRSDPLRRLLDDGRRRAEQLGGLEFERTRPLGAAHGDGDVDWDAFDACREIDTQGFFPASDAAPHSARDKFICHAHKLAAKNGALDVSLLKLGGRPVAFGYNYCFQGRVSGLRLGYAGEASWLRSQLLAAMLQDSYRRGDDWFDLGPEPGESGWATHVLPSYRYTHYPRSAARAQLLRVKHWLRPRVA